MCQLWIKKTPPNWRAALGTNVLKAQLSEKVLLLILNMFNFMDKSYIGVTVEEYLFCVF